MDAKLLLDRMLAISDSRDRRVDTYIQQMETILEKSPEWNARHERIFEEMKQEVRSSRRTRNVALGAALLVVMLVLGVWLTGVLSSRSLEADRRILEDLQLAMMPIRLHAISSAEWLTVSLDTFSSSRLQGRERVRHLLGDAELGRHYGLGRNKPLDMRRVQPNRWLILPASRAEDEALGYIQVDGRSGEAYYDNMRIELGEVIPFDGLDAFVLRVEQVKRRNPDVPDVVEWTVRFGEKAGPDTRWDDRTYLVNQTANGRIEKESLLVDHPNWDALYVVSLGIGRIGEVPEEEKTYAWNLRAFAHRIGFV